MLACGAESPRPGAIPKTHVCPRHPDAGGTGGAGGNKGVRDCKCRQECSTSTCHLPSPCLAPWGTHKPGLLCPGGFWRCHSLRAPGPSPSCIPRLSGLSPFLGDNDTETLNNVLAANWYFDEETFESISDEAKDFVSNLIIKEKRCGAGSGVGVLGWVSLELCSLATTCCPLHQQHPPMSCAKWGPALATVCPQQSPVSLQDPPPAGFGAFGGLERRVAGGQGLKQG